MAKKKLAKKTSAKKATSKKTAKKTTSKSTTKSASKSTSKQSAKKATAKKSAKKATAKKSAKKPVKMTSSPQSARSSAKPAAKPVAKATAKKSAPRAAKKLAPSAGSALVHAVHLSVGQLAPDFSLPNENGDMIHLSALRGKKIVLYFYPKDDTPGCTQESCDFRDNFGRLSPLGVTVLGISKDSVESHVKFKNKYSLPFSLLSDENGAICEAYGVWKEKNNYGKTYMGIERSTFIIDENGVITHVYAKVSVAGHVDEVLAAVSGGH